MNLRLFRKFFSHYGIFSVLLTDFDFQIAVTLEHSYLNEVSGFLPKIPDGTFLCVRGLHQLSNMKEPFETFEIMGVPGHTKLLFHAGNFNKDSEGCVLLGEKIQSNMITNSRLTFDKFMKLQDNVESFGLTVY